MKTYRGIRDPDCHVLVLCADAESAAADDGADGAPARRRELLVPAELLTRPPGPFDWGAGGETPGTHYLAIALLADLLGISDRAGIKLLLPFVRRFLARLPREGFEISDTVFYAMFAAVAGGARGDSQPLPGHRTGGAPPGSQVQNGHTSDGKGQRQAI